MTVLPLAVQERLWDPSAAWRGLEHWQASCDQTPCQARLHGLLLVFGASWHFSRHALAQGSAVLECIPVSANHAESCFASLLQALETRTEQEPDPLRELRLGKNAAMICALVAYLWGWWDQQRLEQALSQIADTVLRVMIRSFRLEQHDAEEVLVLGMGRLAGREMNFASDLDLIFLGRGPEGYLERLSGKVRKLLQAMRHYAPDGVLYAIDMRLRPHGRAGTLISSHEQFVDFHSQTREVWERQMMTRHRQIHAHSQTGSWLEQQLQSVLYVARMATELAQAIVAMREQAERAAGHTPGQYDLKRGPGGLMDIDFISHYFQLLHGHQFAALRTASTRQALQHIGALALLPAEQAQALCTAYDFLKRVECALRVHDMKTISSFHAESPRLDSLARAAGCAPARFLDRYHQITAEVRRIFVQALRA